VVNIEQEKRVKTFKHIRANSVGEAVSTLARYGEKAAIIAGGTDLLGKMKDRILPAYPEAIIDIKTIPGLDFIMEEEDMLKIGALTRLHDIANDTCVQSRYTALAKAAGRTASPNLRQMGTIGGNICQDIRCWYYRSANNRFPCLRKGGGRCYAINGDNRFHSIFGGSVEKGCYAVHPSDIAPALIALDARIKTSKLTLKAEAFFKVSPRHTTALDYDEIVTEIQIPAPSNSTKSDYIKFAIRKSIDFPIVNCASLITLIHDKVSQARICLNAVYVTPYRAVKAENAIMNQAIDESSAEAAGNAAVADAKPMKDNSYMVQLAKTAVKRTILACK
jgi:xanthine dehydrogenase YagS FAD-binding subunit